VSVPAAAQTTRISLELPTSLVDRLQFQVDALAGSGIDRRFLVQSALEGMLREFETIDAEEGVPCSCGGPWGGAHLKRCTLRPPAAAMVAPGDAGPTAGGAPPVKP
jgi:hypothetical protein